MEKLKGHTLKDIMNVHGTKIRDYNASAIIKGILEAVAYLHERDIAHRDLKPGYIKMNIFYRKHNVCQRK